MPKCFGSFGSYVDCCGLIEARRIACKYFGPAIMKSNPEFCCLLRKHKAYLINCGQCTNCCKSHCQACKLYSIFIFIFTYLIVF